MANNRFDGVGGFRAQKPIPKEPEPFQQPSADPLILTCGEDNLEQNCCCWVQSNIGKEKYGHTYIFNPVKDPVIGARINGGPSEERDVVNTNVWIKRGTNPDPSAGWEKLGTAPLPRFPNNEISKGVAFAVEGTINGVLFGDSTNPTDQSKISICSPLDPEQITPGNIMEISSEPGQWQTDSERLCKQLTQTTGCTINTLFREGGLINPDDSVPLVGEVGCLEAVAATTLGITLTAIID